ncbi:radical SAM family heme chaperone HemW [Winkia sp. UMB3158]|nr:MULTISPECIES: radical SAM family heme chaperone HemW [Winkia]MCG7302345.1 radical SAM family heme chaperone HemW [Winkia sp. ACRQY]MDK8341317.1 radical SAM family heme chaperone HemW [Winkia sp. UMB3164B]MBS5947338.1 coproporphyrinogen III oxidase [Winkia neuii]MDK6241623.1 radical SAM family heme chaperone HemW [Winkia sp. UMB10116]MDK7150341.1 radical SAM family heme chaperone HemW [Winkia sp. UMB3158]
MTRPFSAYVHVPFCRARCGYCDFNTYVADFGPGANRTTFDQSVALEIGRAKAHLGPRQLQTVFFGGGTPTMLPAAALASILSELDSAFPLASKAEVTTEANPETVSRDDLFQLAKAGFTRVSFGMQSAVPRVLATLDRTHRPERVPQVVQWAKEANFAVSLDLIYGAPGESIEDWNASLDAVIGMDVDHVSCYALVIEGGTKMANDLRHGKIAPVDQDVQAEKYRLADARLSDAGFRWYEISNWARPKEGEEHKVSTELENACKHNLAYWRNWDWWGFGPGAHSHLADRRFWNVKHPLAYANALRQGRSTVLGEERLDATTKELERIMLGVRISEGLPKADVSAAGLSRCRELGWVDEYALKQGRVVATLQGRLMADSMTLTLLGS